jgi:hypothetical protein
MGAAAVPHQINEIARSIGSPVAPALEGIEKPNRNQEADHCDRPEYEDEQKVEPSKESHGGV